MKLSELVALKNRLLEIDLTKLTNNLETLDGNFFSTLNYNKETYYSESINDLIKITNNMEVQVSELSQNIQNLIKDIDNQIDKTAEPLLSLGYIVNNFLGSNLSSFEVEMNDRQMSINDSERSIITNVIRGYTDWRFPTLEIGPGDGVWTESLVAADPLYIVDRHQEALNLTLSKFNSVYRNRVRAYLTGTHAKLDDFDFTFLPKNQFGFIFAWNVFNFWPYKETENVLTQCYDLLRPGGSIMFSFNDCDFPAGAKFAESGYMSFLNKKMLLTVFNKLGFELKQFTSLNQNINYVEIIKPGLLTTTKRHQTLGRICSINS